MRVKHQNRYWKTFRRVTRSYSWKEKFASLALVLMIFYLGVDYVRGGNVSWSFGGASGRYTEGMVGEMRLINPLFVDLNPVDRAVSDLVFSGLMKYDPEQQQIVEDIATFHVSDDKKVYGFRVKEGVKWHDGEQVDADDLYYTFHDVIQSPDFPNPILKANFEGVEVVKVDPMKIEFHVKSPNSFFMANLTVGILPQHILGEVPVGELLNNEFNLHPIGNGPYMMTEAYQKHSDRMEALLTVNTDYFSDKPKIKEIRLVAYPSYEDLVAARSTLNAIDKLPGDLIPGLESDERFSLYGYELPQYTALFLNMESEIFKKRNVRLALQKSIDRPELIKELGVMKQVDTPLLQLDQGDWLNKHNIEEAKGALYDARWRFENEGDTVRKDQDDNELKIRLLVRRFSDNAAKDQEMQKVVAFVKKSWEDIGVGVDVLEGEEESFIPMLQGREYDVVLVGQSLGYNLDTYSYWHSSQAGQGLNLSNYRSFAADQAIESAREDFEVDDRKQEFNKLAQIIAADIPAIFLYRPVYFYVTDNKVENVNLDNLVFPSDKFKDVAKWTLE